MRGRGRGRSPNGEPHKESQKREGFRGSREAPIEPEIESFHKKRPRPALRQHNLAQKLQLEGTNTKIFLKVVDKDYKEKVSKSTG